MGSLQTLIHFLICIVHCTANTGGLMGLCLGFSGLSAMEVIYFLTLRAWCRTRRRRTIGAKVAQKFFQAWTKVKLLRRDRLQGESALRSPKSRPNFRNTVQNLNKKSQSLNVTPPLKNKSLETTPSSPPSYNNAIMEEISPFYSKRYWSVLEMSDM